MISFAKYKDVLLLAYQPENNLEWVEDKFKKGEELKLRRTFFLTKENIYKEKVNDYHVSSSDYAFQIAILEGEYFKFNKEIFNTEHNFYMHNKIAIAMKHFIASTNKSIFMAIDRLVASDVYIGGHIENSIPYSSYLGLINRFPNTYELWRYSNARIDSILRSYLETKSDEEKKYNDYMNKKSTYIGSNLVDIVRDNEIAKYRIILNKLTNMLSDESTYSEKQWQTEILQILQLIYPKYINVFDEVPVRDTYNNKTRSIDYILIDANGNIDIAEIKKPFTHSIVTKTQYRDNHIPLRELSGSIMQIEKYIFYLNKWGKTGEDKLTEKYRDKLPKDFKIESTLKS